MTSWTILRRSASFIGFANKHGTALLHTEAWQDYSWVEQTLVRPGVHFFCMVTMVVGTPNSHMVFLSFFRGFVFFREFVRFA